MLWYVVVALAAAGVVAAHAAGRYGFARVAKLPLERVELGLRGLVRIADVPGQGWSRAGALVAGLAAANLAVAALAFGFFSCRGVPVGADHVFIREVLDGAAAAGKLAPGDRVVAIDGEPVLAGGGPAVSELVNRGQGAPVRVGVVRDGAPLDVTVQPRRSEPAGDGGRPAGWLLGVRLTVRPELDTSVTTAAAVAIKYPTIRVLRIAADYIDQLLPSRDDADPGGPVRIVQEFGRAADQGLVAWDAALWAASHVLLVLWLLDLASAVALGLRGLRRRPAG